MVMEEFIFIWHAASVGSLESFAANREEHIRSATLERKEEKTNSTMSTTCTVTIRGWNRYIAFECACAMWLNCHYYLFTYYIK